MNPKIINIVSVVPIGDYALVIRFDDGVVQEVDFRPFLSAARHPDIRQFLDLQRFGSFRIDCGDLVWGDYDLCFPIMDLYTNQIDKHADLEQVA